jgi:hypothetical protein
MVPGIALSVVSAMAQQERKTLIDRTMSGLRTAKRNGKILGRPRRTIDWDQVNQRVANGESCALSGAKLGREPQFVAEGITGLNASSESLRPNLVAEHRLHVAFAPGYCPGNRTSSQNHLRTESTLLTNMFNARC